MDRQTALSAKTVPTCLKLHCWGENVVFTVDYGYPQSGLLRETRNFDSLHGVRAPSLVWGWDTAKLTRQAQNTPQKLTRLLRYRRSKGVGRRAP